MGLANFVFVSSCLVLRQFSLLNWTDTVVTKLNWHSSLNESKLVVCVRFVQVYFCVIELQSFLPLCFALIASHVLYRFVWFPFCWRINVRGRRHSIVTTTIIIIILTITSYISNVARILCLTFAWGCDLLSLHKFSRAEQGCEVSNLSASFSVPPWLTFRS